MRLVRQATRRAWLRAQRATGEGPLSHRYTRSAAVECGSYLLLSFSSSPAGFLEATHEVASVSFLGLNPRLERGLRPSQCLRQIDTYEVASFFQSTTVGEIFASLNSSLYAYDAQSQQSKSIQNSTNSNRINGLLRFAA